MPVGLGGDRLGVDIGGVIAPSASAARLERALHGEDTELDDSSGLSAPVPGALDALSGFAVRFGRHRYLVSKAGAYMETRTKTWLKNIDFYERTGIPKKNVHFCRERADKAQICERLGLTHFVDDRLEVLGYLRGIVATRILFAPRIPDEPIPIGILVARSWDDLRSKLGG